MYALFRSLVVALLKCPATPPEPPAGSHDSVQIFRAAPAFLSYRLLNVWIALFFAALAEATGIVALIFEMHSLLGTILAAVIVVVVLVKIFGIYALTRLDYEVRYYLVTDRSLRIRDGVVVVRETTITFANIQNMRIEQGPLQRMFGIYDLVVETAGGGGGRTPQAGTKGEAGPVMHQGIFRGIGRPAELRDLILSYQRGARSSGLGDHDDEAGFAAGMGFAASAGLAARTAAAGAPVMGRSGLGPAEVAALRSIRAETAAWRRALEARSAAGG